MRRIHGVLHNAPFEKIKRDAKTSGSSRIAGLMKPCFVVQLAQMAA